MHTATPSTTHTTLQQRLASRTASIAVVGLGYVGLPLAMGFAEAGFEVHGIDENPAKVEQVMAGKDYIHEDSTRLAGLIAGGTLSAARGYEAVSDKDVLIICVPTPLTRNREPDISYVSAVSQELGKRLRPGQLVVLESTTYPGTTEEVVLPALAASGYVPGVDFHLAFSPERVDPGNKTFHTLNTPKIIGGLTSGCSELTHTLYSSIIDRVHVASSPRVAEMVKLLENIFRCVNIALVNEMALLSRRMDIDIWEVVDLAATKPYGFMPFYPGPGLGGHCIPIDPFYLSWKAREYEFQTRFIELAGEINMQMPEKVVELVIDALGTKLKSLRGSKVLVLGAAYKKDVADWRESPSLKIIELMLKRGATVAYNDDLIPTIHVGEHVVESVALDDLAAYDCVVIATDHSYYDYAGIVRDAKLVVDTRNATRMRGLDHVFVL
jgi:UDP-N-acetyl-D-glucosamine dehydrogenase